MELDFNKRELKNFLKNHNPIGEGHYGLCYKFNDYYLLKAYVEEDYRDDYKDILRNIKESKLQDEYSIKSFDQNFSSREDSIRERMHRLAYTKYSYDLIQGPAFYEDYCFGCILSYYKNQKDLDDDFLPLFRQDAIDLLFHNIDVRLEDLLDNYIYPVDIKSDNILFDQYLDVKLIDLDDSCTIFADRRNELLEKDCRSRVLSIKDSINKKRS